MGTPGFAAGVLRRMLEEKYQVVAVVTAPDKPAGRGRQLQQSEVKTLALEYQLPVLQPTNLKSAEFIEALRSFKADLQIVVAFRMLPEIVWNMPPAGTFNLHASLLPQYRGAAPINHAIMNGESRTGVTTFFIRHEIDTGNVLMRSETGIGPDETAGELHDKLMQAGAELVVRTIDLIASENFTAQKQEELLQAGEVLKEAPKIFRETCRIDWKQPAKKIHDFVRGLSPYPGAWTIVKLPGQEAPVEMKIYRTKLVRQEDTEKPADHFPFVKTENGYIRIEELQVPGKKRMNAAEFSNGYKTEGAIFM